MVCKLVPLITAVAFLISGPSQAEWIQDSINPHCSEEARNRVAVTTRRQIENSVRRAEAAIKAPAATGDLSCMDGLMSLSLDWFAPSGGLESLFAGSLDGVIGNGANAKRVCQFAARKWREVTRPVKSPLAILRHGLPSRLPNAPDMERISDSVISPARPRARTSIHTRPSTGGHEQQSSQENLDDTNNDPVEKIWESLYGAGSQ